MNLSYSEFPEPFCHTFAGLAFRTWHTLADAQGMGHEIGEESITDFLILELKRMQRYGLWVNKFNRVHEGRTTGADWEWWLGSRNKWFGMRVQAKKIDSGSSHYRGLYHTVRGSRRKQVNLLIKDAKSRRLYPLYCFYNYWDGGQADPEWKCGSFAEREELWGCTVADAVAVRDKMAARAVSVNDLSSIWFPWICLVCCRGFSRGNFPTLPYRVRGIARQMAKSHRAVPMIKGRPPDYVTFLKRQQSESRHSFSMKQLDFNGDVDGILVLEEHPEA